MSNLGTAIETQLSSLTSSLTWFKGLPTYRKIIGCVAFATGTLITRLLYCKLYRKFRNHPPGPEGIPFLGCLFSFRPNNATWWLELKRKGHNFYHEKDGILMFYILGTPFAMVNDHKLFQQALKSQLYRNAAFKSNRKDDPSRVPFSAINGGEPWSKRRQMSQLSMISLINSNYIDTVMKSLITNNIFPEMDEQSGNHSNKQYFCRDHIQWLGFAFLFGVLYGANSNCPLMSDPKYIQFMQADHEGLSGIQKAMACQAIPIKFIRDYMYFEVVKPHQPLIEMREMMAEWEIENRDIIQKDKDTYFNRMSEYIDKGEITLQEVCIFVIQWLDVSIID